MAPKIKIRKPANIQPVPLLDEATTLEETLAHAAAIMVKHGVLALPPGLLGGLECADNMTDPLDHVRSCIESPQLAEHLRQHGFEDPERCKQLLLDTMMMSSNPVQSMTFSGSWWQIQTARAIGASGFWGALQIMLESGLHDYPIRELMKASRTIFTHEATIRGAAMQRENYHSDSAIGRKLIYDTAWSKFAEFMGWVHKASLIPAGQLQMQVNMGDTVDPHRQNSFMVVDHKYTIPAELLTADEEEEEEDAQPPAAKKRKKVPVTQIVSHWRKLASLVNDATVTHLEKNAKHYYLAQGKGHGFVWTAMRPADEVQPSGLGIHGGIAPLDGKPAEPMEPRLATVVGGQTLPMHALLNDTGLLQCVARSVWELSEGRGACHTFLAKANRAPSFANGYGAGKHKDIPSSDMTRLRRLRVADATMPGPEGGFRHDTTVSFEKWSDMYLETVRIYIETLVAPPTTPLVIQHALAFCIRSLE